MKKAPTNRELEVFRCIATGLSASETAEKLHISETTVCSHKNNLRKKFKARNCCEVLTRIFADGFLCPQKILKNED